MVSLLMYAGEGDVHVDDDNDKVTHRQVSPVERMDDKGLIAKVDDTRNLYDDDDDVYDVDDDVVDDDTDDDDDVDDDDEDNYETRVELWKFEFFL